MILKKPETISDFQFLIFIVVFTSHLIYSMLRMSLIETGIGCTVMLIILRPVVGTGLFHILWKKSAKRLGSSQESDVSNPTILHIP